MNKRIIFEAPDNCGKDTQIKLLSTVYAKMMIPYHVLHYSSIPKITPAESKEFSKILYEDMFRLILNTSILIDRTIILNRSHIGENVYAPMYRNTPGDWIFDIEIYFNVAFPTDWKNINLITFIDSAENLIKREDGKSFSIDIDKKNEEIKRFIRTTERSFIRNKIIIDIDGKNKDQVHQEVINFLDLEV
jgi:thymidylate kinase